MIDTDRPGSERPVDRSDANRLGPDPLAANRPGVGRPAADRWERDLSAADRPGAATVGAGDIARLAGVGRAAVSNWRRRFPDFPQPLAGSATSPQYSLVEIENWLARHGRPFTVRPADRVWQRIRGLADDLRSGDLIGFIGAFLIFRSRHPGRWRALARQPDQALGQALPEAVVAAVPELPGALPERIDPDWAAIARLAADTTPQRGQRELFDFLCDRYLDTQARRLAVTPYPIAELLPRLAGVTGRRVLDPAAGTGTLLLAAAEQGAAAVIAQELNPTTARLCAARLLLRGHPAHVTAGDSLRADALPDELADVVLCDPPFHDRSWGYDELTSDPRWEHGLPPRGEPELAWVQHCLARVRPGGLVAILMPAAAAGRRAGRRIRANLLRSGALRAVISLPTGNPANPGIDLWLLHRPPADQPAPSVLLMADATADPSIAPSTWQAFLADPHEAAPGGGHTVRIIDLLDDEVDLRPARRLAPADRSVDAARFTPERTQLSSLTATLADTLPELDVLAVPGNPPMTTLGELAKAGIVALHRAPLKMVADAGDTPVLTVNDVRLGRPPSGRGTTGPGTVEIEPGDVVLPLTTRHPTARVVGEGGCLLGPHLLLLRVDPRHLDPHLLAGFLHASQQSAGTSSTSSAARADIRRVPVPRLPLAEQRRYAAAFQRLAQFADQLAQTEALGRDLIRLGFAGLADGSLQPPAIDESASK